MQQKVISNSFNVNVVYDGENGKDGKGVVSVNIYYLASASVPPTPSGAPPQTGWADDGNSLIIADNADKHLYESSCSTYTDGSYSWTRPVDDGLIRDMASAQEQFALSDSATAQPTSGWATSVTPQKGKWIWSRTVLTFKNGSTKVVGVQCVGYCGEDGFNAVRLDISNEMDMISTTAALRIDTARTVETTVRLFDGATEVDISSATVSTSGGPASSIATATQSASGKGRKLSWAFKAGQTMAAAYEITVSYTYKSVAYTAVFTVSASKGEAVWQLKPSMSAIPFQRNSDNTLTPASRAIGLSLVKIDGGSTATYTSVQTGLTVRYSTSSMPSSASAGTGWSSGNITVANSAENLYIALFNASGVLLDRETVPVVKDGAEGKGIKLTLNRNGAYTDAQWDTWCAIGHTESWSYSSGDPSFTDCRVGDIFVIAGSSSDTGRNHVAQFRCTAVSSSSITGVCISHIADGESIQGAAGHTGRFYYFAGTYDGTPRHYKIEATQAPYVKVGGEFYMLDLGGVEPGTIPYAATEAPSDSSTEWTKMQSAFAYYIAQAFFGENAYLGSFIINGDWMITKYGLIFDSTGVAHPIDDTHSYGGYSTSNAYTLFNPSYPNSSQEDVLNFCPAWAVDGMVGRQYHNGVYDTNKAGSVSIDSAGFAVKWGGEGFRVGSEGLQRYDSVRDAWLPMYNKRNIIVDKNSGAYYMPTDVDYLVNGYYNPGQDIYRQIYLPNSANMPDGAVITVRGLSGCYADVRRHPNSNDILTWGDSPSVEYVEVESADRVEFVLYKGSGVTRPTWYINWFDQQK